MLEEQQDVFSRQGWLEWIIVGHRNEWTRDEDIRIQINID
jgi:hypothetical protein